MTTYDEWKGRSDLDEAKLYPVPCMIEGCERLAGESTIEGSTGLCDDHLEERWPLEPVDPQSRIFEIRRSGRLVAKAEALQDLLSIVVARNVPEFDRLDEGELELVEETIRAFLACAAPPSGVKIWPNLAVTPAR